jgi:Putative beta-barrel porin-2, OmpL-like. bbp2
MRAKRTRLATLCLALAAPALADDDVAAQLERMNGRIERLEQELRATHDALDATSRRAESQAQLIERAGLARPDPTLSGLARFLEQTRFDGWVAASYWWNLNNPQSGTNLPPGPLAPFGVDNGALDTSMPFHPDPNSFEVDQVWFAMSKPASAESRAGFAVDLVFGKTADVLDATPFLRAGGIGPGITTAASNANLSNLYQAYVEFLAPLPGEIRFTAGRFATQIGVEDVRTTLDYNVTRGLVYQLLQPVNHVGVKAEGRVGPVSLMLGVANDSGGNLNVDFDSDKAVLWGIGVDVSDTLAVKVDGLYGGDARPGTPFHAGRTADALGIVDLVVRWDPSDRLGAWLDVDYVWSHDDGLRPSPEALGVAAAARYGISESTGFAIRGEYIWSHDNFIDPLGVVLMQGPQTQHLWSLTGTLDHELAEHLTLRGEVRYDHITTTGGADDVFFVTSRSTRPLRPVFGHEQIVLGAEAVYQF